ncbi:MAG: hypothetical protein Q9191_002292, partial [Dirinaria sp. TL-2023a]
MAMKRTPTNGRIEFRSIICGNNTPPRFLPSFVRRKDPSTPLLHPRSHSNPPHLHRRWQSTSSSAPTRPKTALFFPGQGVQRVGMAGPWLSAFPATCVPFLEEVDHLLSAPLSRIIASGPNSALTATENAQPAIMAVSIMILRVLEQDFGFRTSERIDVCLGHSLGEFAALVSSAHLDYVDALKMVRRRAEVMAACSRAASRENQGCEYGMVAVVCEPERLGSLIETVHAFLGHEGTRGHDDDSASNTPPIQQVLIANINSKNQIVLSGNIERIHALLVQLRQFGGHDPRAVRLGSDSPFHSPLMADATARMRDLLASTPVRFPAAFPCVSNVSARPFESEAELKDLLARQCVETVRWWDSIRYLDQEWRVKRWVGLGPGKVGRNL